MVDRELVGSASAIKEKLLKKTYWHIAPRAPLLKVLDADRVDVIARSAGLKSEAPDGDGVIVAGFSYGKGRVAQSLEGSKTKMLLSR